MPVTTVTPNAAETTFYGDNVEVLTPSSYDEVADILRDERERGRTVIPSGLGRHAYLGNQAQGPVTVLSLRELKSVLRYEPGDFTIGAQAGIPYDELRAELADNGQEIPVDVPSGDAGYTLGGAVASNVFGARSGLHGAFRNYVIGAVAMRGDGSIYKTGGMVVKNVAGYDISKLLIGSLGTLGILLEVNFKLRPIRQQRVGHLATFSLPSEAWAFVRRVRNQHIDPVALTVLSPKATLALSKRLWNQETESWSAFWMFEGNHGTVTSLDAQVETLLSDDTPVNDRQTIQDETVDTALDHLVALQTPETPEDEELGILRLSGLSTNADQLMFRVQDIIDSAPNVRSNGLIAHVANGIVVARIRGPVDALAESIERISSLLGELDATGRVLYACRDLRERQPFLLTADPNVKIVRAMQQVFDPDAFFHASRISQLNTP